MVFADWLDEQDDPSDRDRAEFVRLQCALARLPIEQGGRTPLHARQFQLLHAHWQEWFAPILNYRFTEQTNSWLSFRGSADEQEFRRRQWKWSIDPYAEHAVDIRLTSDVDLDLGGIRWFRCERGFGSMVEVLFGQYFPNWVDAALAAEPIYEMRFSILPRRLADGMHQLARWQGLAQIRSLDLSGLGITERELRPLLHSPLLAELQELQLSGNRLGDAGVIALAECPWLRNLQTLKIRLNAIYEEGGRALARSPYLDKLKRLEVSANSMAYGTAYRLLRERFGEAVQ